MCRGVLARSLPLWQVCKGGQGDEELEQAGERNQRQIETLKLEGCILTDLLFQPFICGDGYLGPKRLRSP